MFLAYKGEKAQEEIEGAKNAVNKLCGEIKDTQVYHIPDSDINHNIVIVAKKCDTPKVYPRTSAKISKSPL